MIREKLLKISILINVILIFFGSYIANLYIIQAIALGFAILACDYNNLKIKKDTLIWLILGIFLVGSALISIDFQSSMEVVALIVMSIIIKMIYENDRKTNWPNFFINSMLIASGIHVLGTMLQLILPQLINQISNLLLTTESFKMNQELYETGGYAGITGQTSVNAFYIAIFIGIIFSKILLNKKYRKINIILLIVGIVALFLTGKRSMLLVLLGTIILISFYLMSKDKKNNIKYLFIMIVIISIGYIVLLNIPEAQNLLKKMQVLQENGDVLNGRDILWEKSINVFRDNVVMGVGIGAIQDLIGDYSHNVYIQLLAETGITGLIIYCFAIIMSLMMTLKKMKKTLKYSDNTSNKNILAISLFIQIIFICYSFSGNPLYGQIFLIPYIISIAMANSVLLDDNDYKENEKNKNIEN